MMHVAISCVRVCGKEVGEEGRRMSEGRRERREEKVGWKKRKVEGGCVTERRLCTVANKWPAITCNLPYIQAPWPPSRQ